MQWFWSASHWGSCGRLTILLVFFSSLCFLLVSLMVTVPHGGPCLSLGHPQQQFHRYIPDQFGSSAGGRVTPSDMELPLHARLRAE